MDLVYDLLVVTHLLGMAAVVGGSLAAWRTPRILQPVLWGARAQVVTGLVLVGLAESGAVDTEVDRVKVAVKLVVALVVAGLAERHAKADRVGAGVVRAVLGLAVLNVLVAVLW